MCKCSVDFEYSIACNLKYVTDYYYYYYFVCFLMLTCTVVFVLGCNWPYLAVVKHVNK
jgi:hypothetical protein